MVLVAEMGPGEGFYGHGGEVSRKYVLSLPILMPMLSLDREEGQVLLEHLSFSRFISG